MCTMCRSPRKRRTTALIKGRPPESLRAFPLLSNGCAIREGRRSQCGGAALARLPWPGSRALAGHGSDLPSEIPSLA
ncbi:hypothetical protein EXV95_07215 [Acidovorax sp. JMULE5]|nr:hypothetical protein EXV95_07215 [Acidovorax sp. JMULE5]